MSKTDQKPAVSRDASSEGTPDITPDVTPDVIIDARRLLCPLPILRVEAAIRSMASGAILAVRATDPGLSQDLPAWCKINGHHYLGITTQNRELLGLVAKQ